MAILKVHTQVTRLLMRDQGNLATYWVRIAYQPRPGTPVELRPTLARTRCPISLRKKAPGK